MSTNTHRGNVLQVPTGDNPGLIFVNGQQVTFKLAGLWQSPIAPTVNQIVDVTLNEAGVPVHIAPVDAQTLAKEKFSQIAALTGDQGQQAAAIGKAVFQQVSARMGLPLMVTCAVLFLTWFLLPSLSVRMGQYSELNFTVSNILGLDLEQSGGESHFGFLSFLGLVAVALPWIAPWVRFRWSSLSFSAPLILLIVAFARVRWQMHVLVSQAIDQYGQIVGSEAARAMSDQMSSRLSDAVSFDFGFWLVLILSLALAILGTRRLVRAVPSLATT